MIIDTNRNLNLIEVVRFAIVGGGATILHSSIYVILLSSTTISGQLANFCGFSFAVLFSYFGQKYFTFQYLGKKKNSALKFGLVSGFGLVLNSFWVFGAEHLLEVDSNFAVIGIATLTPLVTFVALKFWVFKR